VAQSVLQFACTIPPNTPSSAPVTIPLDVDNWELESIDLEVPAGPSGLMGFAVYNNGMQWIPSTPGAWLVWDDILQSWYMDDQPNASGWAVVGYNEGFFEHTVTVRFHVNSTVVAAAATPPPTVTFVTSDTPAADPVTF
jgi:hypothetical protein